MKKIKISLALIVAALSIQLQGFSQWIQSGNTLYTDSSHIGIGTAFPLDNKLIVNGGDVRFEGANGNGPMFWAIEDRSAVRIGRASLVDLVEIDSIGEYSFTAGWDNQSIGYSATALGYRNIARGHLNFAVGYGNITNGWTSIAMGLLSRACLLYTSPSPRD